MDKIDGAVALVTGAAGGIGLAIAKALLAEGARVALADIDEEELSRVVPPLGARALAVALDVTDRAAWASAREAVEEAFGPVSILVNNAGIGPDGFPVMEMDPANWDRTLEVNLTSVFNGISCFGSAMAALGDAHIVNVASMAGLSPIPRLGAYTATKFAVVGLSEALRGEMAGQGVGVSVLCPGFIRTRLAETTVKAGVKRAPLPQSDSKAAMAPETIGALVVDGIRCNRALIVSHGEYRALVEKRGARLLAAFDEIPAAG